MSIHTEHQRMKPILNLSRQLHIAKNPTSEAIFETGAAGFQIWCTQDDHPDDPEGWNLILDKLIAGTFTKPCGFVASVCWKWEDEKIVGLLLETSSFALTDHLPENFTLYNQTLNDCISIRNRPVDIAWAESKIEWLFVQSGSWPCLPIFVDEMWRPCNDHKEIEAFGMANRQKKQRHNL